MMGCGCWGLVLGFVVVGGRPSGPSLLSPFTLTLALSRCCWVFWGRGEFLSGVSPLDFGLLGRGGPLCPSDISPASGGKRGCGDRIG